jgi:hypothetical protein
MEDDVFLPEHIRTQQLLAHSLDVAVTWMHGAIHGNSDDINLGACIRPGLPVAIIWKSAGACVCERRMGDGEKKFGSHVWGIQQSESPILLTSALKLVAA